MKQIKNIAIALLVSLAFTACDKDEIEPLPQWWYDQEEEVVTEPEAVDNIVVAHRCGAAQFGCPDNSVTGLRKCIANRLFAAEIDIHITKDGKVVVYHDDTFHGLIFKDASYADLCAAGKLSNGKTLPLFETFVDQILEGKCTRLWVDLKSMDDQYGGNEYSIAAGVAAAKIVREKKAQKFVEFIAGRLAVYSGVRGAVGGEWLIGYMNAAYTPAQFLSNQITWANFEISNLYQNAAKIKTYLDKSIRVSTYNADTAEQMQWFAAQPNLYAVCTNYPMTLLSVYGIERAN